MLRSLKRDESGIAMGLAIVLIVLVGVMGAGLLVFVQRDLEAVVETNRGQDAFETTDAGVQAAERQLLSDACPESYDGQEAGAEDDDDSCADSEESDWSSAAVEDENDSAGKALNFDGRQIEVNIRHLEPTNSEDEANSECVTTDPDDDCFAPEVESQYPEDRKYFQVEITGESDSGNARRRVEAIFYTTNLDVPEAYYSPEDITLRGDACISDVSVFSLGDIKVNNSGGGNGCDGEDGSHITGTDEAYGDWDNEHNSTARSTERAGFAAVDEVDVGEIEEKGDRDFDGTSDSDPRFVEDPGDSQDDDEITFPFDRENQDERSDEERLRFLKDEAMRQEAETGEDTYRPNSDDITDWPDNADENTVVYIDAGSDETVRWGINGDGCSDENPAKGILVIDGASLKGTGNKKPFSGATIVRGGGVEFGGSICWDGFVDSDEEMTISGTPDPFVSPEVQNRPGFYGVETWSWRELYE